MVEYKNFTAKKLNIRYKDMFSLVLFAELLNFTKIYIIVYL